MDIDKIKKYMKSNNVTYADLSLKSGIAVDTLKQIFCGKTKNPRIDTMDAIMNALNLQEKFNNNEFYTTEEKILVTKYKQLDDWGKRRLENFMDALLDSNTSTKENKKIN